MSRHLLSEDRASPRRFAKARVDENAHRRLRSRCAALECVARLFACLAFTPITLVAASVSERAAAAPTAAVPEPSPRHSVVLDTHWRTVAVETGAAAPAGVETAAFDDHAWRAVDVPHNWDEYEGARQVRHGDRHGTAWYRRSFAVASLEKNQRLFLFFEGVGSYATVWVNGRLVGRHAGGLTTFTLDITPAAHPGADNLLVVRADHPAGIRDLPWVCGGCEQATGFSEGTEPFGIFRPVHLITTDAVRIEPFGVHVWNDADVTAASARIHVTTEIKNYGATPRTFTLLTRILPRSYVAGVADPGLGGKREQTDALGSAALSELACSSPLSTTPLSTTRTAVTLAPGETRIVVPEPSVIMSPRLWSPDSPFLYTLDSELIPDAQEAARGRGVPPRSAVGDRLDTAFGIRAIHWPEPGDSDGRFLVNDRPVFINGVCDYEHNLGNNHAFTAEQVCARVGEIEAAGFNAFRDAHTPHNLRFQSYWDADGVLWWPQFGAHIWFDTPEFRANFKALLRDWVKERRNSPSLVLWGLQNESVLPADFAAECAAIIRELDPTASTQRKITTCNGGTGTDWNVPQNWSGTYSGNPLAYADDLRRQRLVGEYGAWRSLGLHTEGGFEPKGPLSEDRMTALLETKVRLAESVRDQVCGHFLWLLTTHSNPGRTVGDHGEQFDDGIRPLDHVSPANNKGLFTLWGEPLDAYEMYRSNFTAAAAHPMVYIASHTWPDRWTKPGRKSGIVVYSNCDEVELFNDLGGLSLGRRTRTGRGTHFEWDDVDVETNILYAEGRVGGQVVARDLVQLHHLPAASRFAAAQQAEPDLLAPAPGRNYVYRVNCGGPDYTDTDGNLWLADRAYARGDAWGSLSWAAAYPNLDPRFGSVRKTYDPIVGTRDPALFQTYRYGRDQLRYRFSLPNGDYTVELYFAEPWYGDRRIAGTPRSATELDCTGWRLFDVAVNGHTILHDLDLWREAGRAGAVKKTVSGHVANGYLELSFPRVAAGQAVISAIAISTADRSVRPAALPVAFISDLGASNPKHTSAYQVRHALDTADATYSDAPGGFTALPLDLLDSDWIQGPSASPTEAIEFRVNRDATVYVAHADAASLPAWLRDWTATHETVATNAASDAKFTVFRHDFSAGAFATLGSNSDQPTATAPRYIVFVVPRRPAPPAELVRDVRGGQPSGSLTTGRAVYTDRDIRITTLPALLADADLVAAPSTTPIAPVEGAAPSAPSSTALGASAAPVTFTVAADAEIYVALDTRITTRPAWLADWIAGRETLTTSDGTKYVLLHHRFAPNQRIELGANGELPMHAPAAMYFVIARSVRPAVLLEAEAAARENAELVTIAGASGGQAVSLPSGPGHSLTWTVVVGVGDRYGLNFRYTASTPVPATSAELTITGADGHIVRADKLEFPAITTPGTWSTLHTRTGASINAGTYHFRLTLRGPAPLIIDSLEVE